MVILMADDDQDDCDLLSAAFSEIESGHDLRFVTNGAELLEYLRRDGRFATPEVAPTPALILLDLNMPVMNGIEALGHIKEDPELRRIPVVVFTTSTADEDVEISYDLGAAGYVVKPGTFDELVRIATSFHEYWARTVRRPRIGI